jgi:hypothetical protein
MMAENLPSGSAIELERVASNTRILEVIFGLFGGFGIGWLYAGNYGMAIALLIFSVLYSVIGWSIITLTAGICGCIFIPVNLAIAFLSGNNARAWAMKNRAEGSLIRVIVGVVGLVVIVIILVTTIGVAIAGIASQINPVQ